MSWYVLIMTCLSPFHLCALKSNKALNKYWFKDDICERLAFVMVFQVLPDRICQFASKHIKISVNVGFRWWYDILHCSRNMVLINAKEYWKLINNGVWSWNLFLLLLNCFVVRIVKPRLIYTQTINMPSLKIHILFKITCQHWKGPLFIF